MRTLSDGVMLRTQKIVIENLTTQNATDKIFASIQAPVDGKNLAIVSFEIFVSKATRIRLLRVTGASTGLSGGTAADPDGDLLDHDPNDGDGDDTAPIVKKYTVEPTVTGTENKLAGVYRPAGSGWTWYQQPGWGKPIILPVAAANGNIILFECSAAAVNVDAEIEIVRF